MADENLIEFEGKLYRRTGQLRTPSEDDVFMSITGIPVRAAFTPHSIILREILEEVPAPAPPPRMMRLPKNSQHPNYVGLHPEDDWCAKAGCVPAGCAAAPTRPPFETFTGPTCKGCYALGSACGTCEKCRWEQQQPGFSGLRAEQKPSAPAVEGAAPPDETETRLIMEGQFRTGFMLGVEFGFKQGEKGRNFEHALDEAAKALSPRAGRKA